MVGTFVLNQPLNFSTPHENHAKTADTDFSYKEQECISLVKKCQNMVEFKQVQGKILKFGLFDSSFCASNLLATCALSEWGSMDYACSIFRGIEYPGSFEFNFMIRGQVKDLNLVDAILMYLEMLEMEVEPDNYTFPAVLKACSGLSALDEGVQIHGQIVKLGLVEDLFVQNSLINMYGKCGKISSSCSVFEQMDRKSVASWSSIIGAHSNLRMWDECLRLFRDMNRQSSWRAEESTLVSVLSACAHLGALDSGKSIHGYLLRNLSGLNIAVRTSLIDMYIRSGCIDKGMCLFRETSEKNEKSYSVVISGLATHGRGEEALTVFKEMLEEGLKPDDVVYVGVLSSCSHAGLVQEGTEYFERMRREHEIEPTIQHYGCMVDLMGRAGMIAETFELINGMKMKPNDVIWRSLLNACKIHWNLEAGEIAAEKLLELNTENPCDYIILSKLYAQEQKWEEVSEIWKRVVRKRLGQVTGSSSVEVKRKVHKFVSDDRTHPRWREIYEMLHQMELQLRFEGYSPDTSEVLFDVEDEEKQRRLRSHSQKLALAFSLIQTSEGSTIKIVRSVRMCSDCHTYTKLISVIYEREIRVGDRNMFHHFRDGYCSCKDYW